VISRDRPSRASPREPARWRSNCYRSGLRSRVGTFSAKVDEFEICAFHSNWRFLLTLPVAMVALCGNEAKPPGCSKPARHPLVREAEPQQISASGFVQLGRSFALCTATSTLPPRRARSISAVNILCGQLDAQKPGFVASVSQRFFFDFVSGCAAEVLFSTNRLAHVPARCRRAQEDFLVIARM